MGPIGLAPRGLAATLCEDGDDGTKPHGKSDTANLVDFVVRGQRGVVGSTFSAELNGLVGSVDRYFFYSVHELHKVRKE